MEELQRIGLTKQAHSYLEEILDSLNSEVAGEQPLIKFDLYRLAVALGVKKGKKPEPPPENTDSSFRVAELDPDKALYFAVKAANLQEPGESIYRAVESLGEKGVREFYEIYHLNMGKLYWDKLFA